MRIKRNVWVSVILAVACVTILAGTVSAVVASRGMLGKLSPVIAGHARRTPVPTATARPTPTATPVPLPDGNDWTQYRFDVFGTGVNPEGELSSANVGKLTQRWAFSSSYAFESAPAVVDGVVYATNGNALLAIDLRTGTQLWKFDGIPQNIATTFSSVAVDQGTHLAYYGSPDGRVYAVDTRNGTGVWSVRLDASPGAFIWSSPLLTNGKVYVGLASHDDHPCVRGAVFALDPATGQIVWSHYIVPANELGGGVWSSLNADPDADAVIVTTGNPCELEQDNPVQGGVIHAQEDAFLALNWDSGNTLWQYTPFSDDECDCDFGEGPVIFTYQGTKYVVGGNKLGMVYALVPPTTPNSSPQLAWSQQITGIGYLGQGGIFEPPTYSNGIIYIAAGPSQDGACTQGALWALRANTGASVWRQCTAGQVVGASSVVGDVLFVGQQDKLVAYAAATGQVLWQAPQPGPHWGGVAISRGFVLAGSVSGKLYCYALPGGSY